MDYDSNLDPYKSFEKENETINDNFLKLGAFEHSIFTYWIIFWPIVLISGTIIVVLLILAIATPFIIPTIIGWIILFFSIWYLIIYIICWIKGNLEPYHWALKVFCVSVATFCLLIGILELLNFPCVLRPSEWLRDLAYLILEK